ncbi:double-strand break repair protein MRE11 [Diorhabda sublineata]|uniref:double-strand break repair protein MRE11 n=1 Tax=Diorhabda sublineata TaxID=1163346 RepID=UPI0024E17094|nr:double-strand break repair protein MRE11 [Diorhabda sublineata]
MSSQESASQSTVRSEDDTFNILVATDIHLGYAEDDPIRGSDTFDTFEEILQIAVREQVDFILLGGDLFHYTQPSPYCINKCIQLIKQYCLGDKPVAIEFLSDPSQNFTQCVNPVVNYEDPNLNISIPIFSIHGNHDDPTGKKHISAIDLLSTSGLVNYFGRWNSFDKVHISPILLKKSNSKLALYGLSHIRDERLGRLFLDDKVKMFHPQNKDEWFHLLVWHQNRATRGTKNFIPDNCLPSFLDLVIWGHEHDCRINPERKNNDVFISQPGSSVATSLIEGESIPKKVGLLKINKSDFKIIPIELKTVRPFVYGEMTIKDDLQMDFDPPSSSNSMMEIVGKKVDMMISEAKGLGRTAVVSEKPLIRLIIKYKSDKNVFNTIRFGQFYVDKVANSDNMVKFQLIREYMRKNKGQNTDDPEDEQPQGPLLPDRVEDLVSEYLSGKNTLKLFPLNILNEAVKKSVDSNDANAISDVTDNFIKKMLKDLEKDMPEIENTEICIDTLRQNMEEHSRGFVENVCENPKRQKKNLIDDNENDDEVLSDSDDRINKTKKTAGRGRGSTRARRGRGSASTKKNNNEESDNNIDDDSDESQFSIFGIKNITKPTGKGSRGGKGRGKK